MSDRNDWRTAADEFRAAERARLGPPPCAEELVAFSRGELSEREADRIRELLVAYPELADALAYDEPAEGNVLTEEEAAADLAAIRQRLARHTGTPQVTRPRRTIRLLPIAAGLCIAALGGLLIESRIRIERLRRERDAPHVSVRHELTPADARRGGSSSRPYSLPASEEHYVLVPLLFETTGGADYRLDVVDVSAETPRTIWTTRTRLETDDTLSLSVPRTFFKAGATYRIDLYESGSTSADPAARYFVRVTP